ncbi:MAG: NAD(P)H-hydrate epimerase, partial [Fimbriimonadaceae bacterium]|nr:NAD(P)H-hydrate epimerase [Alphaproteobacteria bacterium]
MIELLTLEEMYEADRLTIVGGTPGLVLMEHAGERISHEIIARWPKAERVVVLCGPGNNGGDGFVMARLLVGHGYHVTLALAGSVDRLGGDAAHMAQLWNGPILAFEQCELEAADLLVDAIFGAGLTRLIEGRIAETVEKINASAAPVIAVDLPTGINGDTGQILGAAVQADLTVTFFRKKTGHVLMPGRDYCGEVRVVDIGISNAVLG